jgi:hypothetical protein
MLPLRHNREYFIKYQNIILENQHSSFGRYLEIGVLGPSEWTQQLQDPLHREEQETRFTLSMD